MRTTMSLRFAATSLVALVGLVGSTPPAAARPAGPHRLAVARLAEPHPEINRAIVALETAKFHLQRAAHDFGGHRVAAIAAIDRALRQLRLALQFDRD